MVDDGLGNLPCESFPIDRQGGARRHGVMIRGLDHQRLKIPQLLFQQGGGRTGQVRSERVAAHQFGALVGFMHGGGGFGSHFVQDNANSPLGSLPSGFRARKSGSDYGQGLVHKNPVLKLVDWRAHAARVMLRQADGGIAPNPRRVAVFMNPWLFLSGLVRPLEVASLADAPNSLAVFFAPFLNQVGMFALRAFLDQWFIPGGELAFGVLAAPIERPSLFGAAHGNVALAISLGAVHPQTHGFGEFAIRVLGAGNKLSKTAHFHNERGAALVAFPIDCLDDRGCFPILGGRLDLLGAFAFRVSGTCLCTTPLRLIFSSC